MVLHAEHRFGLVPQTLHGPIVQIDVCHFDVRRQRIGIDREAVILRGDLDLAGFQFLHGMVGPAVAKFELVSLTTERQGQNLVTEADAEHRHIGADELARIVDCVVQRRRISRVRC